MEDFYFAESRHKCKAYEGRKSGGRDHTCAGSKEKAVEQLQKLYDKALREVGESGAAILKCIR